MENPSSPLDTLRQLKEMLDAGALTPAEFESLKQRLVLNPGAPVPPAASPPTGTSAHVPPVVLPPVPAVEQHSPPFEDLADVVPAAARPPVFPAATPVPNRPVVPQTPPVATPETWDEPAPIYTGDEFPAIEEVPARNPLALILSIGGVLVFLAVVAYLTLNRPASEHISSTSQTAADSVSTAVPAHGCSRNHSRCARSSGAHHPAETRPGYRFSRCSRTCCFRYCYKPLAIVTAEVSVFYSTSWT
jgi:hypothetical protein